MQLEKLAESEHVVDRMPLIREVCQVFIRGFEEDVFTFHELRNACRLLSMLMKPVNGDTADLCLLASRAETLEQFTLICTMRCPSWRTNNATIASKYNGTISETWQTTDQWMKAG
jgi:hypothetical protein